MTKLGDYEWTQLSMWEFAPEDSVEWFKPSINPITGQPWHAHYYLCKCFEVVSDSHSRWDVVKIGELTDEFIESLK